MIEVTILSILQGVAEFLPISSSGHLVLGQHFLGINTPGMRLDIFLHLGTLVSICAFYWMVIWRILKEFDWKYVFKIIVSGIPAIIVALIFKDSLEGAFEDPRLVGVALVFTGFIIILTRSMKPGNKDVGFGAAIKMGLAQALALIPGVSRSGMTLVGARAAGVRPEKSAEFSFLMSAPLIVGAALLEVIKSFDETKEAVSIDGPAVPLGSDSEISWTLTIYGSILAAVVGYLSLKLLVKSLSSKWFWLFGVYCILAGLAVAICI